MRVYMRVCIANSHPDTTRENHTQPEHTTTGKGRNTGKAEKPEYICMIADNEKKV